jgi:hypothetical protein
MNLELDRYTLYTYSLTHTSMYIIHICTYLGTIKLEMDRYTFYIYTHAHTHMYVYYTYMYISGYNEPGP